MRNVPSAAEVGGHRDGGRLGRYEVEEVGEVGWGVVGGGRRKVD